MIEINGHSYNLCLLDTNALSNLLKNKKEWISKINSRFDLSKTFICYSIFSLSELWYTPKLFKEYLNYFSDLPSAVLDGYESIFQKEVDNYNKQNPLLPIVFAPYSIKDPVKNPKEALKYVLETNLFVNRTQYWKNSQKTILDGMVNLIENYPPKNKKYSIKEIETFCFIASTSQIVLRNIEFAKEVLAQKEAIDLNRFPSIKSTSYVVYYKFYPDKRTPELSDVVDIIISSLLPYVDFFITEKNLNHIVKQIQRKHDFLCNVNSFTIKDVLQNSL